MAFTKRFVFLLADDPARFMIFPRLSMVLLLVGFGGAPSAVRGQAADSTGGAPDTTSAPSEVVQRVATAFSEGDASRILRPSGDRIEISLFGERTYYSDAQALYVLREFFRRHVPRRFSVKDIRETGTNCFVRGEYKQARVVQQLLVYVRLSQSEEENPWRLEEVRIERASE